MCVLVFNALAPLTAQAVFRGVAQGEPGEWMEVCSSTGMVRLPVAEVGSSYSTEPNSDSGQPFNLGKHCPICHLNQGDFGLPPHEVAVALAVAFLEMPAAFEQVAPTSTVWLSARSRAPPAPI